MQPRLRHSHREARAGFGETNKATEAQVSSTATPETGESPCHTEAVQPAVNGTKPLRNSNHRMPRMHTDKEFDAENESKEEFSRETDGDSGESDPDRGELLALGEISGQLNRVRGKLGKTRNDSAVKKVNRMDWTGKVDRWYDRDSEAISNYLMEDDRNIPKVPAEKDGLRFQKQKKYRKHLVKGLFDWEKPMDNRINVDEKPEKIRLAQT